MGLAIRSSRTQAFLACGQAYFMAVICLAIPAEHAVVEARCCQGAKSCNMFLRGGKGNLQQASGGDGVWGHVDQWVPEDVKKGLLGALSPVDRPQTRLSVFEDDFLHLGHARAALLNDFIARSCNGTLLVRFEDLDADNRLQQDTEHPVLRELALLGVRVDRISRASDHVEIMLAACARSIQAGSAYVDVARAGERPEDCSAAVESTFRDSPVSENIARWSEMLAGAQGYRVRARLNMSSTNPLMRDPVLFHSVAHRYWAPDGQSTHCRFVRPCPAFQIPYLDHVQDVTTVVLPSQPGCAEQYAAICAVAGINRSPHMRSVAPMTQLSNAPLSARLLRRIVSGGLAEGHDDPRMPTVRGLLRQGLRSEALRAFALMSSDGSSCVADAPGGGGGGGDARHVGVVEESQLWALNQAMLAADKSVPRLRALVKEGICKVMLRGVRGGGLDGEGEGEGGALTTVLLEEYDAASVREGDKVRRQRLRSRQGLGQWSEIQRSSDLRSK